NPIAALSMKGGEDEAITANMFIASHEAIERIVPPRYAPSPGWRILNWFVIVPTWFIVGLVVLSRTNDELIALTSTIVLLTLHFFWLRFRRQQRRVIRHRDQKAMITYAKRLKRYKVNFDKDRIPIGTHLLLSGILVTINGVVYDLGMPGWLVVRLPKKAFKSTKRKLLSRQRKLRNNNPARCSPLPVEWWNKRPKPVNKETRALEKLIGPAAYRGRHLRTELASDRSGSPSQRKRIMDTDPSEKDIPIHSIKSESSRFKRPGQSKPTERSGPEVRKRGPKSGRP
ncbi:MAG: hypothetical protein H8D82_01325, partial [Euryarchaeota archaeon]|nr:hypothetical protein [Euryarchaeota archaeon]